jgi:hypothetical protein
MVQANRPPFSPITSMVSKYGASCSRWTIRGFQLLKSGGLQIPFEFEFREAQPDVDVHLARLLELVALDSDFRSQNFT